MEEPPDASQHAYRVVSQAFGGGWVISHPAWEHLAQLRGIEDLERPNAIFTHQLSTPKGEHRLVAVTVVPGSVLLVRVFKPGSIVRDLSFLQPADRTGREPVHIIPQLPHMNDTSTVRIFAGRCDPTDRTHFSLPFKEGDAEGMIDVWLTDDEDLVRSQVHAVESKTGTQKVKRGRS
jgi:hypothetical protein